MTAHALAPEFSLTYPDLLPGVPPVYQLGPPGNEHEVELTQSTPEGLIDNLRGLTPAQSDTWNPYLEATAASVFGRHSEIMQGKPEGMPWSAWLSMRTGPAESLGLFMQHSENVASFNRDPVIANLMESRREWLIGALHHCIDQGSLSTDVDERVGRLGQSVATWLGDDLQDGYLRAGPVAYYVKDDNRPLLRQHLATVDPAERKQKTIRDIFGNNYSHELLHVAGLAEWLPEWMFEVGNEDVNQLAIHGGDTRKALAPDWAGIYPDHRTLRQTMLKAGSFQIDDRVYTRAISSNHASSPDAYEWLRQLDATWGVNDALGWITARLQAYRDFLVTTNTEGKADWILEAEAARSVNVELAKTPQEVFGTTYQKPQRHVGAAALRAV